MRYEDRERVYADIKRRLQDVGMPGKLYEQIIRAIAAALGV